MSKIALLATFTATTRVIIDIPNGVEKKDFLDSQHCADAAATEARKHILAFPGDYLHSENLDIEEDTECPYGSSETDQFA